MTSRTFLAGLLPLVVFLLSFVNTGSYWKLTFFDFLCGVCSILALAIWGVSNAPLYAIMFSIIADAAASLLTMRKCWEYPETETGTTYILFLVSLVCIVPSVPVWNLENAGFLMLLILQNIIFIIGVYRRRIVRFLA